MLLLLTLLAAVPTGQGARLDAAIAQYEAAHFAQARNALIDLLEEPGLEPSFDARARGYLAATYLAMGDPKSAQRELRMLARQHPEAKPSRATFPPDLLTMADEIWADAEKRRAQEKPVEPPPDLPPPTPPPAVLAPSNEPAPSRAFAFVPLGIGHFVRGAPIPGALFLVAEVLLGATCVGTFVGMDGLKDKTHQVGFFDGPVANEADLPNAQHLNVATSITFVLALVAVAADVAISNAAWPTEPP
jgi:hypothetical protein